MHTLSRRRFLFGLAAVPVGIVGCKGGPFTIFGYQLGADALYDPNIKTVYVHAFNNRALQTTPFRGMEMLITEAVVNEIGRTTTFRVCSDPDRADTELIGNVVGIQKQIALRTPQNTVRDGELLVSVDVVWRDLRDGTILSAPRKAKVGVTPVTDPLDSPPVPFDPSIPVPPPKSETPQVVPTRITASGRYLQELGETNASAQQKVQNRIAVQIVSMMERKW